MTEALAAYTSGATVKDAAAIAGISIYALRKKINSLRAENPEAITRPRFSKPVSSKGPRDPQVVINRRKRREVKDWDGLFMDVWDLLLDEIPAGTVDCHQTTRLIIELVRLHLGEKIKES
jgi:hypothetical protein